MTPPLRLASYPTLMPPAIMDSWGQTHVGHVRKNNEDAYGMVPELGFFVVADGMGGAAAGERAAELTVSTLIAEARDAGESLEAQDVVTAIERANRSILREAECDPALRGMGTTVTAAIVRGEQVWTMNVGDSRAYRFSAGELVCLTTDHTWIEEYGRDLNPEQIRHHPYRHVLTRAVGADRSVLADTQRARFSAGDILLLCSDGLHGVVPEESIVESLAGANGLGEKADALINAALERGAPDNVTVVLTGIPQWPTS